MSDRPAISLLRSVAPLLSRPVTKDQVLVALVDRVVDELGAERGTLYLLDALTGELCSRVAHLPELQEIRLTLDQGVAGRVASSGEPALLNDVTNHEAFFAGIDEQTGYTTRNIAAVPLAEPDGTCRGVLQVLNKRSGTFDADDLRRLTDLALQVVEALSRTSMRPLADHASGVLIDGPFNNVVGEAPAMVELYQRTLAAATTNATVLIRGETGTGKTLVARAIHDNGARRQQPLVHVDCAALPASLIESELFGHERGAFTGADRRMPGKFEQAEGGTLLLDEIGDLPLPLQSKLLRVLQEREFERVGGRETQRADVRVISATNIDLEAAVAAGTFRRDLYYRIRVVELTVPPLRARGPTDVARLAEHFRDRFARRHRRPVERISPTALERLCAHDWPGNVRELEHCIESAVVLSTGLAIEARHLSLPDAARPETTAPAASAGYPPGTPLHQVEQHHIRKTLDHCQGNRSEAARLLGIGRNTLLRKLKGPR